MVCVALGGCLELFNKCSESLFIASSVGRSKQVGKKSPIVEGYNGAIDENDLQWLQKAAKIKRSFTMTTVESQE